MIANQYDKKQFSIHKIKQDIVEYIMFGFAIILIILSRIYSYLLFHTIAELFSIIIYSCIFIIGWHSKKYTQGSLFLLLGISFLFISIIDSIHTLSYTGMNIFINFDTNLPASLWIIARYIQAISLFLSILFKNKIFNSQLILIAYAIIVSILLISIFTGFFPKCYIMGSGLTGFKIISEYIIILILSSSLFLLYLHRKDFDLHIFFFLIISTIATMISELAFTFYIEVYDLSNLIGHIFKIISAFFIYKALIETGLENPFNILFRKLKESESSLIQKANDLEVAYNEFDQIFNGSLPLRVIDKDFNIKRVNATYLQYFELKIEDILKRKCYDLFENDNCYSENCPCTKVKSGNKGYENEIFIKLPSGKEIYYLGYSLPWKDPNGNLIGYIQNFTDITDRKRAEKRLATFISTASHELRTPTTAIIQSIELINKYKDKISNDQKESLFGTISRNAGFLAELIEDLLTVSKIDEMKIKLDLIEFNPIELISEIIKSMELRIQTKNNIISIEHNNSNITIYGDLNKFNQIFRILIDNGLKYSDENTEFKIIITDHYNGKFNPKNQNGILFEFIDQGIGIPKNDLSNLFERFFRSNNVHHIPGTGLGLVIAKEYIELHNGKIYVESEFGKGTIFSIFLPIEKS
ncbi:MAG: PAS domain-containing protein [Candidatus Lokiarchaeota archaeon]|nr:PAS domain-containing protein [Candidatus Lokiarchaeota archaeon]